MSLKELCVRAWGENDERFKAAADCKELARWLKLPVLVPTQAATEVEEKQIKGKRAGRLDVYGSKGQIHVSNVFIIITDKGKVMDDSQKDLKDWQKDVNWLCDCKKNRDGSPFDFYARHYVQIGKVEEIARIGDAGSAVQEAIEDDEEDKKEEGVEASKQPPEAPEKPPEPSKSAQEGTRVVSTEILGRLKQKKLSLP